MKKIAIFSLMAFLALVIYACGGDTKTVTKPDVKTQSSSSQKATYDKMNDTSFNNVMQVLKEALENERKSGDSSTKLNTAKAYILVIKFIRTDRDKVKKSGMADADINYIVTDAREKAGGRLKEIASSPTAPKALKDEAQAKMSELESL